MTEPSNIVILGGSFAGISTAHYLLKHVVPKLPSSTTYQVVLVSPSAEVMSRPGCPRAIISDDMFPQDKFFLSVAPLFDQYPSNQFRFVHAAATALDTDSRTVSVGRASSDTTETIPYHALILTTGTSTASPLFSVNAGDTETVRQSWSVFRSALTNAKSIVIAGGGPTGVETAGELGEYLNGAPGWFGSKPSNPKVAITVVNSGADILPVLRPALGQKAEDLLGKVGVTVIKNARVVDVKPQQSDPGSDSLASPKTITLDDGRTIEADLYIPATGSTPNTGFVPESLLADDHRVETNNSTFRVEKAGERVYAVGDVASGFRPSIPNIGSGIPVLCANIKRDLLLAAGETAVGEDRIFKEDLRETQLVPIGKSTGVGAAMGWQMPGFLVKMVKGRDYFLGMLIEYLDGKHWAKEA